jgi:hypothetical protein
MAGRPKALVPPVRNRRVSSPLCGSGYRQPNVCMEHPPHGLLVGALRRAGDGSGFPPRGHAEVALEGLQLRHRNPEVRRTRPRRGHRKSVSHLRQHRCSVLIHCVVRGDRTCDTQAAGKVPGRPEGATPVPPELHRADRDACVHLGVQYATTTKGLLVRVAPKTIRRWQTELGSLEAGPVGKRQAARVAGVVLHSHRICGNADGPPDAVLQLLRSL